MILLPRRWRRRPPPAERPTVSAVVAPLRHLPAVLDVGLHPQDKVTINVGLDVLAVELILDREATIAETVRRAELMVRRQLDAVRIITPEEDAGAGR